MTIDEQIKLLGNQKYRLDNGVPLQGWLDTTEHYINDIFGRSSSQSINFFRLKGDFSTSLIFIQNDYNKLRINEQNFRLRARDQITGLIIYLQDKKEQAIKASEREIVKQQRQLQEAKQREEKKNESERKVLPETISHEAYDTKTEKVDSLNNKVNVNKPKKSFWYDAWVSGTGTKLLAEIIIRLAILFAGSTLFSSLIKFFSQPINLSVWQLGLIIFGVVLILFFIIRSFHKKSKTEGPCK